MFDDATVVGSWPALTDHLDQTDTVGRWAEGAPELAGLATVADLLAAWSDPGRTDTVLYVLVRLAAVDGGYDDDALLLALHLLSGVVWKLVGQLRDLSPDIEAIVLAELTCQLRSYPWRRRTRAVIANLTAETRRAVLADLQPTDRYHPDRVEALTVDGDVPLVAARQHPSDHGDLDVVDLLLWAVRRGIDADDVALLVATECARDRRQARADDAVADAHGIPTRTLYRRRERTLRALRELAPDYLRAVA